MTPLALLNVLLILVTLSLAGFAAWAARRHLLPWQVAAGAMALAALDLAGLLYAGE
jgi:hypothetical protein